MVDRSTRLKQEKNFYQFHRCSDCLKTSMKCPMEKSSPSCLTLHVLAQEAASPGQVDSSCSLKRLSEDVHIIDFPHLTPFRTVQKPTTKHPGFLAGFLLSFSTQQPPSIFPDPLPHHPPPGTCSSQVQQNRAVEHALFKLNPTTPPFLTTPETNQHDFSPPFLAFEKKKKTSRPLPKKTITTKKNNYFPPHQEKVKKKDTARSVRSQISPVSAV